MANQDVHEIKINLIDKARLALNGQTFSADELEKLYKDLEKWDQFNYASEILLKKINLDKKCGRQVKLDDYHTLVKYIYKDHSLPSAFKFEKALTMLESNDNLSESARCETMGFAGAIYKRMWQYDHQFKNLILSRHYYNKGYELWQKFLQSGNALSVESDQNDMGYTALNYAYINELMAVDKLEEHGKITGITINIEERFQEAELVRKFIVDKLKAFEKTKDFNMKANKWIYPTIAEAHFGLREYDLAMEYITKYLQISRVNDKNPTEPEKAKDERIAWEVRTFKQQLLSIAYLQLFQQKAFSKNSTIPNVDKKFLPISETINEYKINDCLNLFRKSKTKQKNNEVKKDGKVGLALSGGGFRASLFHIGVLAALAEEERLKDIEVISCVSGGSIIGAFYYLKLKTLLENKKDDDLNKTDYLKLVEEIETEFLAGVQTNLRIQLRTNPWKNIKMIFSKKYSRTHRIGELYEEHFYNKLLPKSTVAGEDSRIFMNDLFIKPCMNEGESFNLTLDNWDRNNKVPQLVLNATCINTGHNWQFTASWMGEPPGAIQTEIDVKPRLRRMYYGDAPKKYQQFPLGNAVGASACVPVLFPPLLLPKLYPGIDLQLVDGGLHDNQGIGALIEQECNNMIISDASGQMPTAPRATKGMAGVFYRADTILQERLRELQFKDIEERSHTTQIRDLIKVHLKDGLQSKPVNWKYCTDPARKIMYESTNTDESELTEYGILVKVQRTLAEIRTDLNSFHDAEAYALMYSAYRQTKLKLEQDSTDPAKKPSPTNKNWKFLLVKEAVTSPQEAGKLIKQLKLSKNLFFKAFNMIGINKVIRPLKMILAGLILFSLAYGIYVVYFNQPASYFAGLIGIIIVIPVFIFLLFTLLYGLYVHFIQPLYNKLGKVKSVEL